MTFGEVLDAGKSLLDSFANGIEDKSITRDLKKASRTVYGKALNRLRENANMKISDAVKEIEREVAPQVDSSVSSALRNAQNMLG